MQMPELTGLVPEIDGDALTTRTVWDAGPVGRHGTWNLVRDLALREPPQQKGVSLWDPSHQTLAQSCEGMEVSRRAIKNINEKQRAAPLSVDIPVHRPSSKSTKIAPPNMEALWC